MPKTELILQTETSAFMKVMTRNWMEWMGVTEHYVTGAGTHRIVLHEP